MKKLAAIGDNCIDDYGTITYCGGNPVNVAVYMQRFGVSASYIGAVGNDDFGSIMINSLRERGVDVSHVHVLPGKTAVTQVTLNGDERILGDYNEGVLADFCISDDDMEFILTHDMVHTGLWGRRENDLPAIKAAGIPIAFDYATESNDKIFDRTLPYVNYAFLSREQEDKALRLYMREIRARGPGVVAVTLGAEGSIVLTDEGFFRYGVCKIKTRDSMGAGDSYIAGFLAGVLDDKNVLDCMRMATQSAAQTLQYMGSW